jgi:hypothetical protein
MQIETVTQSIDSPGNISGLVRPGSPDGTARKGDGNGSDSGKTEQMGHGRSS